MPDRNLLKQCLNKITIDFQDKVSEDDSHMRYTCLKQDDVIGITIIIREMPIDKMKLTTGRKQAHVYFLGTGNKLQGKNQIGHAFTT